MSAQLPKLKPRDLFFIIVGGCVLLLLAWYFIRFQSRQQTIQDLNNQLDVVDTQLQSLQTQQSRLPGLRTDVATLQQQQAVFVRALPSTPKMGQVVADIQNSVTASGGKLDGITVQNSAETNLPAGVQAAALNVNLEGQFAQIFRTLRTIETMGRFSKITGVSMLLPAPNDTDPNLNGVIGMTVYTFDPNNTLPTAPGALPGNAPTPAPAAPAAPTSTPQGGTS